MKNLTSMNAFTSPKKNFVVPERSPFKRLALLATLCLATIHFASAQQISGDYAPGELLIKFRANATDGQLLHAVQGARLKVLKHFVLNNPQHPGVTHVSSELDVPTALRF